jgi:hypothetical protein
MRGREESSILLDVPGGDGEFVRAFLERVGHPVTTCGGPEPGSLCPLLSGEGCTRFEDAHGIVFELDLDRPQHRAILEHYAELGDPELPIRVVVSPAQREAYASLLADLEVWDHEPTAADLDGFAARVESVDRFA